MHGLLSGWCRVVSGVWRCRWHRRIGARIAGAWQHVGSAGVAHPAPSFLPPKGTGAPGMDGLSSPSLPDPISVLGKDQRCVNGSQRHARTPHVPTQHAWPRQRRGQSQPYFVSLDDERRDANAGETATAIARGEAPEISGALAPSWTNQRHV